MQGTGDVTETKLPRRMSVQSTLGGAVRSRGVEEPDRDSAQRRIEFVIAKLSCYRYFEEARRRACSGHTENLQQIPKLSMLREQIQLTTKLDSQLKRELILRGKPYTLVISPDRLALTPKGKRKGYELAWVDLISGDAALAVALNASLAHGPKPEPAPTQAPRPPSSKPKRAKPSSAKRVRAKAS
jgi:hypothetical protein